MKKHIIPSVGQMRLKDLTTLQIQQIYNKMLTTEFKTAKYKTINKEEVLISPAKTYSPKTIRNVHGVLSTALNKAVKTNLLMHNPCDNITLPKSKSFEYVIPERDELKKIIDAIKGHRTLRSHFNLCDTWYSQKRGYGAILVGH